MVRSRRQRDRLQTGRSKTNLKVRGLGGCTSCRPQWVSVVLCIVQLDPLEGIRPEILELAGRSESRDSVPGTF